MNDIVGKFVCGLGVYFGILIAFYAFGFEYLFNIFGPTSFFVGFFSFYIGKFIWKRLEENRFK